MEKCFTKARMRGYSLKAIVVYPGWLSKLLTTQVNGLENYEEILRHLTQNKEAIKIYIEVAHNS